MSLHMTGGKIAKVIVFWFIAGMAQCKRIVSRGGDQNWTSLQASDEDMMTRGPGQKLCDLLKGIDWTTNEKSSFGDGQLLPVVHMKVECSTNAGLFGKIGGKAQYSYVVEVSLPEKPVIFNPPPQRPFFGSRMLSGRSDFETFMVVLGVSDALPDGKGGEWQISGQWRPVQSRKSDEQKHEQKQELPALSRRNSACHHFCNLAVCQKR